MSPNAGEYKSVVGLDEIYTTLVTQDDASAYVADTPEYFAPATEASAEPTTSLDTQYANNKPFDVMASEGETKITMTTTAIPLAILAKYLGKVFDAASGRIFDAGGEAVPPDCALSFRSLKSNGKQRYYQYLKGKFSVPKDEATTKGEKAEPKPAQIIFTGVNTVHKFDLGDGGAMKSVKRIVGDEDTTNFDGSTWFDQVQTPETTAPDALALSSSDPADAAAGVAVTKTPTLTFNNALQDAAVNSVALFDPSDGTLKAATITLDATKKIVSVDPSANLSASTAYLLTYAVTDIYGQTLRGAVNFTTA